MERGCKAKMVKYYRFLKYFAKKKNISEKNSDLPLFLVLELTKVEYHIFLIHRGKMTWHLGIKYSV